MALFKSSVGKRLFVVLAVCVGLGAGAASAAEEVRITSGGLTLNARLELAEGKTLADGVVLMVHG
ncbi:MAG: hypothetical protein VW405_18500, partial [Rhodospirillaceae bacterium]